MPSLVHFAVRKIPDKPGSNDPLLMNESAVYGRGVSLWSTSLRVYILTVFLFESRNFVFFLFPSLLKFKIVKIN